MNEKLSWKKEKKVGDHLPYLTQIDERTIMLRDGRLMQILEVEGIAFETLDTSEINYRKAMRESMLQSIGSSQFALYQYVVRRRVTHDMDDEFPDAYSAELNSKWAERFRTKRLYSNQLFLCIVRRPLQGRGGIFDRLSRKIKGISNVEKEATLTNDLKILNATSETLMSSLSQYGVRRLESYRHEDRLYSEPLEFLSMLLNGPPSPILLPESDIGHYLPRRRLNFGAETIELTKSSGQDSLCVGILSIKEYPPQTAPGFLDDLMRLPIELQVTQSFGFIDRQAALGKISLSLRRMRAADDEAISLRSELADARDSLAAGQLLFGEHHLSVAVYGASEDEVTQNIAEVQSTLSELGLVSVREDVALEAVFWAQFPGNFKYIPRRAMVSSQNFASLASLHNFPIGQAVGNHWGNAVAILETTSAGPYHFNFHNGDLGNFTVIGPSGSGKTVVLNFLLAQARRFNPRIIFFDKDRGAELFLRAIGGQYSVLRAGDSSGLNPLKLEDTSENRSFLIEWIQQLISCVNEPLTPEENDQIKEAVEASMDAPSKLRQLSHFAQLLRGAQPPHPNDLAARLAQWHGKGEHAWLFDNDADFVDLDQKVIGFDMTRLLDNPTVRTPAMMYLFHRVEQRLDGTPTIIVVDEGWKALDDPAFTGRIRDWEKTIRKRNGIVGFATQSAEDALESSIASAIVEQAATQIFMANPKAQAEAYINGFGLSHHEYDLVRSIPDDARAFLIKHGTHSVVVRLDLSSEQELITILSGRENTIRFLDEMRCDRGDLPEDWLPRLIEKAI